MLQIEEAQIELVIERRYGHQQIKNLHTPIQSYTNQEEKYYLGKYNQEGTHTQGRYIV